MSRAIPPSLPKTHAAADAVSLVDETLYAAQRKVWNVEMAVTVLVFLTGVPAFFLLAVVADHWLVPGGLGMLGRTALWLGFLAAVAAYVRWRVWPLLRSRVHPYYAAAVVEERLPGMKNALLNLVFLRRELAPLTAAERENPEHVLNQRVLLSLEHQTAGKVRGVELGTAADHAAVMRCGTLFAAVFVLCCAYFILSPKSSFASLGRMLFPWAEIPAPTRVLFQEISPGDATIFQGEPLPVSVRVKNLRAGEPVTLYFSTLDGQVRDIPLEMRPEGGGESVFHAVLGGETAALNSVGQGARGIQQALAWRISAGDCVSPTFRVYVNPPVSISVEKILLTPPAYTGIPPAEQKMGDIKAPGGTRVHLTACANCPIHQAQLVFHAADAETPDEILSMKVMTGGEKSGENAGESPAEAGKNRAEAEFTLRMSPAAPHLPEFVSYEILLQTPDGKWNRDAVRHRIFVVPDVPPVVTLLDAPEDGAALPVDRNLVLHIQAEDTDYALRGVAFYARWNGRLLEIPPVMNIPLDRPGLKTPLRTVWQWSPGEYRLKAGDEILWWVEAADNRQPAANRARTDARVLKITASGDEPAGAAPELVPEAKTAEEERNVHQPAYAQDPGAGEREPGMNPPAAEEAGKNAGAAGESESQNGDSPGGTPDSTPGEGDSPDGEGDSPYQLVRTPDFGDEGDVGEEPGESPGASGASGGESADAGSEARDGGENGENGEGSENLPLAPEGYDPLAPRKTGDAGENSENGENPGAEGHEPPVNENGENGKNQENGENNGDSGENSGTDGENGGENSSENGGENEDAPDGTSAGESPGESGMNAGENTGENDGTAKNGQPGEKTGEKADDSAGAAGESPGPGDSPSDDPGGRERNTPGEAGEESRGGTGTRPQNMPDTLPTKIDPTTDPGAAFEEILRHREKTRPEENTGNQNNPGNPDAEAGGDLPPDAELQSTENPPSPAAAGNEHQGTREDGKSSQQTGNDPTASGQDMEADNQRGSDNSPQSEPEEGGNRNKGGNRSGGENNSDQQGEGRNGNNTPNEEGAPHGSGGHGPTGAKGGDGVPTEDRTGVPDPHQRPGKGTQTKENPEGEHSGASDQSAPQENTGDRPSDGTGMSIRPEGDAGTAPPTAEEVAAADAANMEFAKKQTILALEHLRHEIGEEDSELLRNLGWSREEAAAFLKKWNALHRNATKTGTLGEESRDTLSRSLRNLGLTPAAASFSDGKYTERVRPAVRSASRIPPPAAWAEQTEAYTKGVAAGG